MSLNSKTQKLSNLSKISSIELAIVVCLLPGTIQCENCFLPQCLKTFLTNIAFYQVAWKHPIWTLLSTKLHLPPRKDRSSPLHRAQPRLVMRPGGSKCWKCPLTRRCSMFNEHCSKVNDQMIHFQEDLPCHQKGVTLQPVMLQGETRTAGQPLLELTRRKWALLLPMDRHQA